MRKCFPRPRSLNNTLPVSCIPSRHLLLSSPSVRFYGIELSIGIEFAEEEFCVSLRGVLATGKCAIEVGVQFA